MKPEISVLLPVRNAEATLSTCLRSLQRQTESRWQCVLVDDGSRDDSLSIARAFAARDPRFVILARPHAGLVDTLRVGLEACRTPFIARMDADDWMHRDRLAIQRTALSDRPALDAVGCGVRIFSRSAKSEPWDDPTRDLGPHRRRGRAAYAAWLNAIREPHEVRREAYVECPIAHPTLFAHRSAFEQFGYRDCGWPEDYDLILRMLAAGRELAVVPRRLLGWRDEPTRLSRQDPRYALDRFTACKAAHLAASFLAKSDEYVLWGYGETGRKLRSALLEYDKAPSLIVDVHPRRLGQRIHGARVIAPEALPRESRRPLIASVAGAGPREEIRKQLRELGYAEGDDFVTAA